MDLLAELRDTARSEREKGTYFERIAKAYLTADPLQIEEYEKVWSWAEWASENGRDGRDVGIDLVARLRNEDGYAAIQAKFYAQGTRIQKHHIDSFISASGKAPFLRRVVIDTTEGEWSDNAEEMIRGQAIPVIRIGLVDLCESRIDWDAFRLRNEIVLHDRKTLLAHQKDALEAVETGLVTADRGKLIMACGTGKTFTALKIAESMTGAGGRVLFMVPSLALMSQTIREWVNDTGTPIRAFAVCSDGQVGKRRKSTDDVAEIEVHDLVLPATTEPAAIARKGAEDAPEKMTVVFATYQSIQTLTRAHALGLPAFDLIICDEAHRTTGATLDGDDESNFVRVHSDDHVRGKKRLYMTATPRVFGDNVKSRADEVGAELASMDDPEKFGEILFHRSFGWAVQNGLLTDYKVIVLAMDEGLVSAGVQNRLRDEFSELNLDDATKIIGCYKALTKQNLKPDVAADPQPMKRALAFCRSIAASKLVRDEFGAVVAEYLGEDPLLEEDGAERPDRLHVEIQHVDGTFNAKTRGERLDWLKAECGEDVCRILTNARCLSEGVDVPALDAIMFLHPRKSQIDVVQSVGRVMRRAPGKRMGYVILPIGIPAGMEPEKALQDNERFRVVWQILNALRAHDDRFDSMINKASLGQDISGSIEIVGVTPASEELNAVTATVSELPRRARPAAAGIGQGGSDAVTYDGPAQQEMTFAIDEFSKAIMAKIVRKCGTRDYWEDWAINIAEIAQRHISRLTGLLADPGTEARRAFDAFLAELRDDLNDSITEQDAIEMLAQHVITRPVFQTLFEGHQFTDQNPVSRAMQKVLDVLDEHNLDKESRDLKDFYASVRFRAQGITDPNAKQRLIVELYEKFFAKAFKRTTEKLGIVYTEVEIVDFILHSVNEVLQEQFGQTLGSKGVHIMDPFTGTGTFITRLLQSGLIAPEEMEHKFRHEIHANEIVLLAYYIAAINIEAVYHSLMGGDHVPFEGICLTDTFQMYESDDLISHYMPDNSKRVRRQKATNIRVVVGNPPYSEGQKNANDNNANVDYPRLDGRIRETYAARSMANKKNSLYNSYIRAIRWASDRIGDAGVVAFVSNAGWIDGNSTDGLRACMVEEFSELYIFHLRGNANTLGERRRKEKGNVFGEGTRTPIAISVLAKNPSKEDRGRIFFHDIGDYLDRKEKLEIVRSFESIAGITNGPGWTNLAPDDQNDWVNQRDASFDRYLKIGDKQEKRANVLFENYSLGVNTNRDSWTYNFSPRQLEKCMQSSISTYNDEVRRFSLKPANLRTAEFINSDPQHLKWSSSLVSSLERGQLGAFSPERLVVSTYRPFQKVWLYYDKLFIHRPGKMASIFPAPGVHNLIISVPSPGNVTPFSALMTDTMQDLSVTAAKAGAQCFPLYFFDCAEEYGEDLFTGQASITMRRDAITDAGLKHFQDAYPGKAITKEDIFFYVYGLLHSQEYRDRYADNLTKALPRIPRVKKFEDFRAFVEAGRRLGDLHVNYETVEPWAVTIRQGDLRTAVIKDPEAFYRVTKMKFAGKRGAVDKTTVIYNANITMQNIPLEAYDYVVNGKPALEWVMERQVVKTDTDSGIVNDANQYAIETMKNPAYPLELFQRIITVSLQTTKIVRSLPALGELS